MRSSFEFVVTANQFAQATRHSYKPPAGGTPSVRVTWVVLWASLVLLLFYALEHYHGRYTALMTPILVLLGLAIGALLLHLFFQYRAVGELFRSNPHAASLTCRLTVENLGLRLSSPHQETVIRWAGWSGVDELGDLILLRRDRARCYTLPASAFESKEEQANFIALVRERIHTAKGDALAEAAIPRPSTLQVTTTSGRENNHAYKFTSLLRMSVVNAFRLAFLQRNVAVDGFPATWWQVATFGALTVAIPLLYDFATIGIAGRLDWEAVPLAIAHIPVILLAVIVTAHVLGSGDKTLSLLQTFLMIAMAIDVIVYLTYFVAVRRYPQPWPYPINVAYDVLPAVWLALACARAAAGPLSGLIGRKTVGYAVCILLIALPLTRMYRERSLWQPANNEQDFSQRVLAEDALYSQPEILERDLSAVKPGRRGVVDVYFIGIGGYANQDVFMKEVDAVSRLFRERFGSEGRSIRLVNNSKSLPDTPLASVTGLRKSLQRVAEVMNNDEDVVFLFLTSHGSPTHRLALDFSPLQFHELTPQRLRGLLDESGIKNRVVVVSACYSGGFIEPLKTDSSLIIAASAADKNSFGCTNEAEWTYFGKAFFDEALRETHSFVEAFESAKPVIAAREKEQGFTPSEPQMVLGHDIKPTLLRLQQQFTAP